MMFEDAPIERHVIPAGKFTWLIINAPAVLPNNIPSLDTYPTEYTRFSDLLRPMWASPANIHVAMTPRNTQAPESLSFLGRRGDNVELVCDKYGKWLLEPKLCLKWSILENNLNTVVNTLRNKRQMLWGIDDISIKMPWQCGYRRTHKTRESAALAVAISREAFTFLQSHVALVISTYKTRAEWWADVMTCNGAHESFANLLAATPMTNFSRSDKRVGIYIDMSKEVTWDWFRNYWSGLGRAFVPLYIRYTNKSLPLPPIQKPGLLEASLTDEEVQYAKAWHTGGSDRFIHASPRHNEDNESTADIVLNEARANLIKPTSEIMDIHCPNIGPAPGETSFMAPKEPSKYTLPISKFPAPRQFSNQLQGENVWHYYDRRRSKYQSYLATETEEQRTTRLSRERTFRNCPTPGMGKHAPKVFVWELWFDSDEVEGFYELVPISKQNAAAAFTHIDHNSQRRYDPVKNEWHLWEGFAPDELCLTPSDDDFPMAGDVLPNNEPSWVNSQDWQNEDEHDETVDFAATATDADAAATNDGAVVDRGDSDEDEDEDQHHNAWKHGLNDKDALRWYFGFSIPDGELPTPPELSHKDVRTLQRDFCASLATRESMEPAKVTFWRHVGAFRDNLHTLKNIYWIANPEHREHHTITPDTNILAAHIWYRGGTNNNSYLIELSFPLQPKSEFRLLVYDPAAVVFLRRCCGNLTTCLLRLAGRGIPFNMVVRSPRIPRARTPSSAIASDGCLGFLSPSPDEYGDKMKLPGFQAMYQAYLISRESLLRSSRGRAALSRGGIVWRLAIESLDPGIVLVDGGPNVTDWEGRSGGWMERNTKPFKLEGDEYRDDHLNESEEAIICGVYKVLTDADNNSVSDMSWWPKSKAWKASGLNIGYWSELAEEWYLKRRKLLREGECVLMTTKTWKKVITFSHNAHKNADKVRDAMASVL